MTYKSTIQSRWSARYADLPSMKSAKFALDQVLSVSDDLRAHSDALAKDEKLTDAGRTDAMRVFIGTKMAGKLYRSRKVVETMRAKVEERHSRLQPPTPDPADTAAALVRQEIRAFLRGQDHGSRVGLILGKDADPQFLTATLEAPDAMSGVDDEIRARAIDRYIENTHPGELEKTEEINESIALFEATVRMASYDATNAAKFSSSDQLDEHVESSLSTESRIGIGHEVERSFAEFGTL